MNNNSRIYGPDDKPIGESRESSPLGTDIQALVKAEVNTAMDVARQRLDDHIMKDRRDANIKAWIRYAALAIANVIFGFIVWMVSGPEKVREWTREFVQDNMNKPTLAQAAREVVSNRMDAFTTEKLRPLGEKISSLSNHVAEASTRLAQLQQEQEIMAIVNRAETYDRAAIVELRSLASGTNQISEIARALFNKLQRSLVLDRGNQTFLTPSEKADGVDFSGPFANDELALTLRGPMPDGAINIVGKDKLKIFIPELVDIARNAKDLWTVNRASKALNDLVGINFYPWDITPLDEWWKTNSILYTNWPYTSYDRAMGYFSSCRYDLALPEFETVLSGDSCADKSRALAIACALELGDTNKAENLRSAYTDKAGRWRKWANCRFVLSTGSVDAATRQFAELSREFPTFSDAAWIRPGQHVLRLIDWTLFNDLKTNEIAGSNK